MTTETRVAKTPLLGQHDLRCILVAAARIRNIREMEPSLGRRLTDGERQLLALCGVIPEIIVGALGVDGDGEPIGDLVLRAQPYARRVSQSGENGH